MRYDSLADVSIPASWLTIGIFDGVHRGHQRIINQLVAGAHAASLPAIVLTFSPHPAVVLGDHPAVVIKHLTTDEERAGFLMELGVDTIITHPFTRELANQTAEDFMRTVKNQIGLQRLLVGYDFALGHDRAGTPSRLAEIGQVLGYTVETMPVYISNGEVISSTRIRQYLSAGQVAEAAAGLGRYYRVEGRVVHGDGRGRKINIPTANIALPEEKILPANGVYACWTWVGGDRYPAVTNVGIRPTFKFDELRPNVETHLLDFKRELYGQEIRIEFVSRLRDELKFSSVDALLEQIARDILRAREILV